MLKDLMKRLTDEIDHKVLLPLESAKIHISEEGDTVRVAVAGKPRYVFPRDDCALLPVPNTTVEMLAQYLARPGRARRSARAAPPGSARGRSPRAAARRWPGSAGRPHRSAARRSCRARGWPRTGRGRTGR